MPSTGRKNFQAPRLIGGLGGCHLAGLSSILAITWPSPPDGLQKPEIELTIKVGTPHALSQPLYPLDRTAEEQKGPPF
ncbi:MAG TPA: hypothetical protein IGS52_03805 [Oscillatoriaceae cyanobacterium M33_DOE_052]|uniref:Uncharacterized protein n=1 Tax=Planktothricoides sp. SpSt-374 TaxID=2282167 RepID=A0A7C3VN05_9CYAN|nr:hypothetical protein [Oscillatoriaceae cyanobacterium M33_DOE_052]